MISDEAVQDLPLSAASTDTLIGFYSQYYAVSSTTMRTIVKRESAGNQYAIGDHGSSYGLTQIHLPAHKDVSIQEAFSPEFSLNFLAYHLSLGQCYLWSTCPEKE